MNKILKLLALLAYFFSPTTHADKSKIDVCKVPTSKSSSQDETAWRLFVSINCKTEGQLTWETWKTQACLNNPNDCNTGRLHASLLNDNLTKRDKPRRTGRCSPMTSALSPLLLRPFVPKNLSANPLFCEEVVINATEESYANKHGLLTQSGQVKYLQSGAKIDFPNDAIEVKADWVPASSYTGVTFDCSKPNTTIYKEMIDGTCYALTGMHISSKLYPNWLWATFEPQDKRTNSNRCNPNLYSSCIDLWGSSPSMSVGQNTQPTINLAKLFKAAGKALDPSFQNYRLTGTQTAYNQPTETLGHLGSSFVEFNAGVLPHQASCITCHSYAQRQFIPNTGITTEGQPPPNAINTGNPTNPIQVPIPFKSLDFSWFLGIGVSKGDKCQDVNTAVIQNNEDAKTKCPSVCSNVSRSWNHHWKTVKQGETSVCGCCNVY